METSIQIGLDSLFHGFVLEPYMNAEQKHVKDLFDLSLLARLLQASMPVFKISTMLGKMSVEIPIDKIAQVITEDQRSKNTIGLFIERRLRSHCKRQRYFLGIRDAEPYGTYWQMHQNWAPKPSHTLPNPNRPLFQKDLGELTGAPVVIDSCISTLAQLKTYNANIANAVSALDFDVQYVLSDYPLFLMENSSFFLPLKLPESVSNSLLWLSRVGWYPYIRVFGELKQSDTSPYLDTGMIFKRIAPPYAEVDNWVDREKQMAVISIMMEYDIARSMGGRDELKAELAKSPSWKNDLDVLHREALFFRLPAVAYLLYRLNNLQECPSEFVRGVVVEVLEIASAYYSSRGSELNEVRFLAELRDFFQKAKKNRTER